MQATNANRSAMDRTRIGFITLTGLASLTTSFQVVKGFSHINITLSRMSLSGISRTSLRSSPNLIGKREPAMKSKCRDGHERQTLSFLRHLPFVSAGQLFPVGSDIVHPARRLLYLVEDV